SSEDEKTPIRFGARKFEATSNPVEIEVVAEYAPWGENFDGDLGGPSLTIAEFRPPAGERDAGSGPLQPDDILPPILGYDVKLNFADPVSRDGSFHGEQSVVFSLSFHKIEALQTDILFGRLLVGQTTWPVQFKDDTVTFKDGSSGKTIRTETWSKKERQFDLVLPLPLTYGKKRYVCPVHIEMTRTATGKPLGSYWFCAYLSGRLPWGAGGRIFEIVNLDQQMEFRPVGDGTDKRDAVLGIDINGDGKIDPAQSGGEQFDLYEPFKIGSKTYRVREVDPYSPRVAFLEVKPGKLSDHAPGIDTQDEGTQEPNEPTYGGRSLSELIGALDDQDFQTRIKAVYHLGYMGPKAEPAVPALVDALSEERLRESILHSLANIGTGAGEAIPALIKAITEYAPACRWMAAEALAKIGDKAVPELKKSTESENIYLRIWCNAALAKQHGGDSTNLRYLAQLMKSADKKTAGEAVSALTMLGPISKPVVPDLVEALEHSSVPRKHIASALARMGKDARPAVPELAKLLQDTDLMTRADAIYALSQIGGPDIAPTVPLLIQALKTHDATHTAMASNVRSKAATALGKTGPDARPAIPALVIALGDEDERVRESAAKAISEIDPTDLRGVPALVEAMSDESGRVRSAAAQSLLKIGPVNREVVLAFIRVADDNWKSVTQASDEFFRLLGPQHGYAVPDLVEMLKIPNERSQRNAITALGRIGPAAAPAAPYILESMKNPNLEAICSGAIAKIGADPGVTVPGLIELLKDKHRRSSAALALERIGPAAHRAIPALEDCVEQSNSTTFPRALLAIDSESRKAVETLVRISESAYVPDQWSEQPDAHYLLIKYGHDKAEHFKRLVAALENSNSRIRLSAAAYLGRLRAEAHEAGESLVRKLKDNDPEVRAEAAHALLLTGATQSQRRQACNVLIALLDGEEFAGHDGLFMAQVRAASALHSFSPSEEWAVPWLVEKLRDTDNSVRTGSIKMRVCVGALKALGNIGPAAREALPHFTVLLRNGNWQVRQAAAEAFDEIANRSDAQANAETTDAASEEEIQLAGRVVDDEGKPVIGAQVALSTETL
ncbi:MAG: HEAT repeat domain-containing protein, partial [Planctomycetota bacterium]